MPSICRGRIVGGLQGLSLSPGNLSDVFILELCLLGFPRVLLWLSYRLSPFTDPSGPEEELLLSRGLAALGLEVVLCQAEPHRSLLSMPGAGGEKTQESFQQSGCEIPWALKEDHLPLVETGEQKGAPLPVLGGVPVR